MGEMALVKRLPVSWQARWWRMRYPRSKIHAIKSLRASALVPLHEAKRMLDPLYARRHPDHG